jgi:hypothetical protein
MSGPLRVLILDDSPADAELAVAELRRAGFDPEWERVDTQADFRRRFRPIRTLYSPTAACPSSLPCKPWS